MKTIYVGNLPFDVSAADIDELFSQYGEVTSVKLIDDWQTRIEGLLEDAQNAGEIRENLDISFEAMGVWAYSSGIGQLSLLHRELLPVKLQKQLISAYLDKLR